MNYTATEIVTEGFRRAGRCLNERDLKRGVENILAEVKHDIWLRRTVYGITQLRSLAADSVVVTKVGVSRYQLPEDFNEAGSIVCYEGRSFTASGIITGQISLPLGSNVTSADIGRRIVWVDGTAEAFSQEITSYTEGATITLGLHPDFEDGEPAFAGDTFFIVDKTYELDQLWHDEPDRYPVLKAGRPQQFFIHSERLQLDRACDQAYALRMRYYVDITRVDPGGKIDLQINRRWYSVLVKGCYWIAAQEIGDTVARDAYLQFQKAVEDLKWQDQDRGADDQRLAFVPWR